MKPATLKEGLTLVSQSKNYSLSYRSSSAGNCSIIFTEKAIGFYASLAAESDFAYIQDEKGVYRVSFDDGYVGGEYLLNSKGEKVVDVWDGSVYKNLYGLGESFLSSIDEKATSVSISDKTYRLNFLQIAGFSRTEYTSMKDLSASIDADGQIRFTLEMESLTMHYDLVKIGESVCLPAVYYLEDNDGPLQLSDDLAELREAFKGNNFRRSIYSFDTESYIGYEYFLPRYFYSYLLSSSTNSGYMSLSNESLGLNGVYMFTLDGQGQLGFLGRPMYEKPDIVEFMHYPTYMKLWENMEFIHYGEPEYAGYEYQGTPYYVTRPEMVYDFVTNNSIDASFSPSTYTPKALGIDLIQEEGGLWVNFVYYFEYGHTIRFMPNPFDMFGNANIQSLDNVVDYYDNYVYEPEASSSER